MMSQNPYEPYPAWFERYGSNLETFPHGEYLKNRILEHIKDYNKKRENEEIKQCQNCQFQYISSKKSTQNCPFCNAPKDFNISKINDWFKNGSK